MPDVARAVFSFHLKEMTFPIPIVLPSFTFILFRHSYTSLPSIVMKLDAIPAFQHETVNIKKIPKSSPSDFHSGLLSC